jgi:hypothetical protein
MGYAPRTLLEELVRSKVVDVFLTTLTGRTIRFQCVTEPDAAQRTLLARVDLTLPSCLGQPWWADAAPEMS